MANNKYKILVVEDEKNIANLIKTILEDEYQVINAYNYKEAMAAYKSYVPDLILLDLGLPDLDGKELIKEIRKESLVAIIVLSARNSENDKVEALDLGANDYVLKPFGTAELLARIRSSLRVSNYHLNSDKNINNKFILKDLVIDYDRRQIFINDVEIKFTQNEYNILAFLSKHSNKVMTYNTIIKAIWGYMDEGSIKKLQVNMANIRKKLAVKPGENRYIINELGVGYRMLDN